MNPILTELGVSEELQAFFQVTDLVFSYGQDTECFGENFHRVPATSNLWVAGNDLTTEVVITHSAMEAIAYLTLNRHRYPRIDTLSFIAIGNLPHEGQLQWIRSGWLKKKHTLVFGNNLLGRLADIKVAAGLADRQVRLYWNSPHIRIETENSHHELTMDNLSLNVFEKAFGIRSGIRTYKPIKFDTFLDQLKHNGKQ
ncbi:hypothetical protein [Mucilaginibacter glaciei]|uniref:Uncharacterized protein n=1 Tax=Mucilaginibacter glaciei TaxID=2772109 RepID=A0A926NUZ4_9SPHI|nr:hypothetical protein [Mucilaginibacter glaciei]MBD1395180.1 hypothetical protein [Mucilaginibacter glaciei]